MPTYRVYYDKTGTILEVEHRPDENYTKDNLTPSEGRGDAAWIVVDAADFNNLPVEGLVVKSKKLRPKS